MKVNDTKICSSKIFFSVRYFGTYEGFGPVRYTANSGSDTNAPPVASAIKSW